jgi:hypothetical protein
MEIEVKAPTQRGDLSVDFDREAQPTAQGQADDVWDAQESSHSQKFFIAPGIYIEDSAEELHRQKMMFWGDMPQMFTYFMPAGNCTRVHVENGNQISMRFKDDILAGDLSYRVRMALDFADALARACGG